MNSHDPYAHKRCDDHQEMPVALLRHPQRIVHYHLGDPARSQNCEPLPWSKYINEAIVRWGDKAEVLMAQHHWPTWGNGKVVSLLKSQRDLYRYINDQTLRMANEGLTRDEIAANFKLPDSSILPG